jgi:hypothetical protein
MISLEYKKEFALPFKVLPPHCISNDISDHTFKKLFNDVCAAQDIPPKSLPVPRWWVDEVALRVRKREPG